MLSKSIRYLKGVGPKKEIVFNKLGINTISDIFYYFPRRYEDRTTIHSIKDLSEDEYFLIKGKVLARNLRPLGSRPFRYPGIKASIFEAVIGDDTGKISCAWFNQGYLKDQIKVNDQVFIYGKPHRYKGNLQFSSPEYEIINEKPSFSNVGKIVGFYSLSRGLTQNAIRKIVESSWNEFGQEIQDSIPSYIRKEKNLACVAESFENIHFPQKLELADLARQRFIFEELFFSQILVSLRKAKHKSQKGFPVKADNSFLERFKKNISFELTDSQRLCINDIFQDMGKPYPMHRLLQGDVGCGKTVVACFAIALALANGLQVALMVPTEVLVGQHFKTLVDFLKSLNVKIEKLSSSLANKEKERISQGLKSQEIDVIIGTHSLIQEDIEFKKLGLVVIDEQHKFGVAQRALLPKKGKVASPHCLVMSATPIPRTLALSLYGDLDLSSINELPPGRKQPETVWIKEENRSWMYGFLRERLEKGEQVYVVYPVIEESAELDLKSLNEMYEVLKDEFKEYKLAMFHGKMKSKEKEKVIEKFCANKINILVSTTVIEVGLNIENATTMVVESPERFGLAQLHQLRGRIRRSTHKPYFILISRDSLSEIANNRLKTIVAVNDGYRIAEDDLNSRGPGDFFGNSQSGFPQLKVANPLRDLEVLEEARTCAQEVIKKDSSLSEQVNKPIRDHLDFWFKALS